MAFYLDYDYSKGEWFDYPDQPELKVKLRYLSPVIMNSMRSEHQDEKGKLKGEEFAMAVLNYTIIGWEGFYTGSGKSASEAKVNSENIQKLFNIDPAIVSWVFSTVTNRKNFDTHTEEELTKN